MDFNDFSDDEEVPAPVGSQQPPTGSTPSAAAARPSTAASGIAKLTPITTGKTLSDRFKEFEQAQKNESKVPGASKSPPEVMQASKAPEVPKAPKVIQTPKAPGPPEVMQASKAPGPLAVVRTLLPSAGPKINLPEEGGNPDVPTVAAYCRSIKSLRYEEIVHMREMQALREQSRLKKMEQSQHTQQQQFGLGNMGIFGGIPAAQPRTGLLDNIELLNVLLQNRTQAALTNEIHTARSLNLGYGGTPRSTNINRSVVHIPPGDAMRGRVLSGRIEKRDFQNDQNIGAVPRNGHGSGNSSPMRRNQSADFGRGRESRSGRDNRGKQKERGWGGGACRNYLDDDLDDYMSKHPSKQRLDDELDDYMAAAAAARKNKTGASSATSSTAPVTKNTNTADEAYDWMDDSVDEPAKDKPEPTKKTEPEVVVVDGFRVQNKKNDNEIMEIDKIADPADLPDYDEDQDMDFEW